MCTGTQYFDHESLVPADNVLPHDPVSDSSSGLSDAERTQAILRWTVLVGKPVCP